jgi:hypothetical protein
VAELDLHSAMESHFLRFFEDFNYEKSFSKPVFRQEGTECKKMIFLNIADYQDGLMIEFMLGISHATIEYQLSELLGKQMHLSQNFTFHQYASALDNSLPRRSFLFVTESPEHYYLQMESFFVNTGFYWLDEFSNCKKLSDMLALSLVKGEMVHMKLNYSVIRSLLLKRQLGEKITEDLFYTYLELMQEKGLPDDAIEHYEQLKKYFLSC